MTRPPVQPYGKLSKGFCSSRGVLDTEQSPMFLQKGKRRRPEAVQKSRKKTKIELKSSTANGSEGFGGKVVSLNQLKWTEVALPDQFEDAEGFYGLEEIEDVEVVREGAKVQFKVRTSRNSEKIHTDMPS